MSDWNGHCHRCGKPSISSIMSMFNTELICMECKREERKRPDYKLAEARDLEEHASRMAEQGCPAAQVDNVRETARKLRAGEL